MYLAIEGVIGVGKTTLARMLQPAFEAGLLLEVFEENPFLSNFYADRARYAFQTQMFFLLSRYYQQRRGVKEHMDAGRSLISDYTFEKDALFARVNLTGDELEMYNRIHEALGEKTGGRTPRCSCTGLPCVTVLTSARWNAVTLSNWFALTMNSSLKKPVIPGPCS